MSLRYTLRLVENGAEVWKRWTGDREEALRDLAATLVDLQVEERRAQHIMNQAAELHPDTPGGQVGVSAYNHDLTTELAFDVRRKKGHNVSSQ